MKLSVGKKMDHYFIVQRRIITQHFTACIFDIMCSSRYEQHVLSYLDIQDHLSRGSAYDDYRERERIKLSKHFFVCCNVTKLMVIENEHYHVENSAGFFFQAEDGIRDHCVTGVQTCALPI